MLHRFSAISLLALSGAAVAQDVDESALDALDKANPVVVVPAREPPGATELRGAMRRIAYSPGDADALADAGNASLTLGDANAALNFFTRANGLRPNNARIVSGLAVATVRTENPFEALRLFDDAVRLGVSERMIAADRALAYDLIGNFARAQQDYRLARSASASEDLRIRHAISLSLAGAKEEADAMLVPLLQKDNIVAWRARAFMLAARGDFRESAKVTQGFMDKSSAQRMERYLRLMPDLTGAQQAAAIHLGHFPASQNVGRDSDQVRRVASAVPPVQPSKNESRLIPAGVPLGPKVEAAKEGRKSSRKRDRRARDQEEIKTAVANIPESAKLPRTDNSRLGTETARAAVEQARTARIAAAQGVSLPPPETARPLMTVPVATGIDTAQRPAPQPEPGFSAGVVPVGVPTKAIEQPPAVALATVAPSTPMTVPVISVPSPTSSPLQGPTLSGPPVAQAAVTAQVVQATPMPATPPPTQPAPAPMFDLAAIVGAIKIPESEQRPSAAAVDLKKLKPTLPKVATVATTGKNVKVDPKIAANAKAEAANPARYWVQIATGEASALGFDYRKWIKKTPALFKGHDGFTSVWGKSSRLLVGPFADIKAAKKWEGDFKKAGGDGFSWKSEPGVVVTQLKSK